MKRIINYDYIVDINKLLEIYKTICASTKHKNKIVKYNLFLSENLVNLLNNLKNRTYEHGNYNIFRITHPKPRIVMSEQLNDKVINHLLCNYVLHPILDPKFIDSNCATRKNKGTTYALDLMKKYINKLKLNYDKIYILKLDISKFFYSIDHDILKNMLTKDIKDKDILKILFNIIDSVDKTSIFEKGKALAIGNETSQVFAIYYLSSLDHFIKEKLHSKYYIRYQDDLCILSNDKQYLMYCWREIEKYLNEKLSLYLNKKSNIYELHNGVNYLGMRFILDNKRLRIKLLGKTKYRIKKRIKKGKSTLKNYNGLLCLPNVTLKI